MESELERIWSCLRLYALFICNLRLFLKSLFAVTPTKTVLFDSRVKILHDFGTAPHNYISFNPQGRLIALAGFGNMSGKLNIFDRRTLAKVTSIDAPNTTYCEWSPCGRFLLTATLSPRLRVDNGIKIWHCSGPLMHVQLVDELYQASWRPTPVDAVAAFPPQGLPQAPAPNASVELFSASAKPVPAKPVGAYRPPGARGLEAPKIFKREDEGGDEQPSSGANTPQRPYSRSPAPGTNGNHPNGYGRAERGRGRYVPGAAQSPSPVRGGGDAEKKGKKTRTKRDKRPDGIASGAATPVANDEGIKPLKEINISVLEASAAETVSENIPATPGADGNGLDPVAKKIRNLNKKVRSLLSSETPFAYMFICVVSA